MTEWIREYLNNYLQKEFFTSRKDIENNPYNQFLSNFINKEIIINSTLKLNYMTVFYQNSSNLCGYHSLFYAVNYIQYILTNDNGYYLWRLNSGKQFWKFYKKTTYFLFNAYIEDEFLQKELKNEGSLEREQLIFYIQNQHELFPSHNKNNSIHFYYYTIDFICGQFSIEEEKALQIEKIINDIKSTIKRTKNDIYLFFIGITNHWVLYVINCFITGEVNHYVFDSCDSSTDVFNLNTREEMNKYIEMISLKEKEVYKKKELTNYQKKSFLDWILDMKDFFSTFPLLFNSHSMNIDDINKTSLLNIIFMRTIKQITTSYEESVKVSLAQFIDDSSFTDIINHIPDIIEIILQIYMWLLSQYPPLALESAILPKLTSFNIKEKSILIQLEKFILLNIKLIETYHSSIKLEDSEELFTKFLSSLYNIKKSLVFT